MNNLLKFTTILVLVVFVASAISDDTIHSFFQTTQPRIELIENTGAGFLLQFKGNCNLNNKAYIAFRASQSLEFSEIGFSTGYQHQYSRKGRLQFGAGYSHILHQPMLPIFSGPDNLPDSWDGAIIEVNLIQLFIKSTASFGMDLGLSFIFSNVNIYSSFNLGIVIGIL